MASAADVPNRYDLVINSKGYMLSEVEEIKAQYGYTSTFVERSNTQGDYGDNFQDFWLTVTQRDWSLGEQQRYFRANDQEKTRRYWRGTNVDVTTPGQVSIRAVKASGTIGETVRAITAAPAASGIIGSVDNISYSAGVTKLYLIPRGGTGTDLGVHGLGATPSTIVFDSADLYISTTEAGSVGVRKYDINGVAFSTFSATAVDRLEFLNNTLYGLRFTATVTELGRYDSAGAYSTLYNWKTSDGGPAAYGGGQIKAFGGKLAILLEGAKAGPELWIYDGVAPALAARFPPNLAASNAVTPLYTPMQLEVAQGVIFVSGGIVSAPGGGATLPTWKPSVWYYASGTTGELWRAYSSVTGVVVGGKPDAPPMAAYQNGLAWVDADTAQILFYNPATGGQSTIATPTNVTHGALKHLVSTKADLIYVTSTTCDTFPIAGTASTTATVITSLFDLDSSLSKLVHGIKVEWDPASSGDGGTVDIAYRVGDPDGAFTTLQTGAVSGTEYDLSGITGRYLAVKITLNKGTSTLGPVLKRLAVRASVKQSAKRKDTFVIQLTGRDGTQPLALRDGDLEARDGLTMATELRTVLSTGTPVTMVDEFGSFTGVIESEGFEVRRIRTNEFLALVPVREV